MTKPRLRIIKGQGKRPKGKRKPINWAWLDQFVPVEYQREPGVTFELQGDVAADGSPLKLLAVFAKYRRVGLMQGMLAQAYPDLPKKRRRKPKPKVNTVRVLQPGGTQKTSVRVGEEE